VLGESVLTCGVMRVMQGHTYARRSCERVVQNESDRIGMGLIITQSVWSCEGLVPC